MKPGRARRPGRAGRGGAGRRGSVSIRVLTFAGRVGLTATEEDLESGRHPASAVFAAAHDVITALREAEEAAS